MKKHDFEFTNLEIQDTIRQLLKCWSKEVRCKNIHWISRETLERLAAIEPQVWKWTLDAEQSVESRRPELLDRLFELWKGVSLVKEVASLKSPTALEYQKKHFVLAPMVGPQFSQVVGYFLFEDMGKKKPTAKHMAQIRALTKEAAPHMEFCWQYSQMKKQSYMDDLTSLYNQRYLPMVFEREIARMERMQKKFSVLFLDIDYFKRVNDTRGHWIGSKLLVEVSKIIKKSTRACDYAFRYGGDEFLIVLVDTNAETSQKVAERIRSGIEQQDFNVDGINMKLTVSIGLAVYPDHARSTVELIHLADQAMYYGKHKSRNIVFLAG